MILCLFNVGILQNRYNMAFLQGLIGIVGVDIFRRNSSSFSYSASCTRFLTYRGISGAAFHEKKKQYAILLYGKVNPSVLFGSFLVGISPYGPFPWKRS